MCVRPVDEANEFRNDKLKNKQGRRAVAKAHAKVKQMKRLSLLSRSLLLDRTETLFLSRFER